MFKRFAYVLFLLAVTSLAYGQILQPARLVAETPTKSLKVGDEVELIFKASVDKTGISTPLDSMKIAAQFPWLLPWKSIPVLH
jgi:hypothetical protein